MKGFTMMEMILVMVVVAILFMLSIPNIQKTMNLVQKTGCDAQRKVVDAAILQYQLENSQIPSSMNDLVVSGFLRETQTECGQGIKITIYDGQAK